ncbi:MAG: aldehyde dehydrogenase family protein, partial [Candidatus Eremiobacterota bacterium]
MTTIAAPPEVAPGRHFIDGEWRESERTFPIFHPATGRELTRCAEGSVSEVDRAVRAARKALEGAWKRTAPATRGKLLVRLGELIEQHADELARLTTLEMGKPLQESSTIDVPHSAGVFRYYGEWANKLYGETCPVDPAFLNYTLREPLGVVGAITPWNFPLVLASWKVAPALCCGNTVVLKPPEQAPLATLRLGELALEAGFPPGVLNVVAGGAETGVALTAHTQVDKIAFTGEHRTAQAIMESARVNLKRISFECGGKSPHIVFPDADMEGALRGAFGGIFSNAGQICNAGSRLFVHRNVASDVVERLTERARRIRLGDPIAEDTEMGPVVSLEQMKRVMELVASGRSEGARLACGGAEHELAQQGGYYVEPTVFTQVKPPMRIAREEIFGPVLSVLEFEDEDELVAMANDSLFGLAAGVWTRDLSR